MAAAAWAGEDVPTRCFEFATTQHFNQVITQGEVGEATVQQRFLLAPCPLRLVVSRM